jgi:hypothetical protein
VHGQHHDRAQQDEEGVCAVFVIVKNLPKIVQGKNKKLLLKQFPFHFGDYFSVD